MEITISSVGDLQIAARCSGDASKPGLILLHGWPQSSHAFAGILDELGQDHFALAFDLPGIGRSQGKPPSAEKTVIADIVLSAAERLGAKGIVIAGYDVGGMVAYAAARDHAARLSGAIVMNTVLPGVPPWEETLANPKIFHFALHALAELPELLVAGRQRAYFDFFFDMLAGNKRALSDEARDEYAKAYERPEALSAGFDWYRAMAEDARHNARGKRIALPMLYARGDADGAKPERYVGPLRELGAEAVEGITIPGGEFVAEESPDRLIAAIRDFRRRLTSA